MQNRLPDLGEWPDLEWEQWKDAADTLHRYTQIVGKTRLALTPVQNHWWNVPLYVTARGLSTSAVPVGDGRLLDIEFDFVSHELVCRKSDGETRNLVLRPMPVPDFFAEFLRMLTAIGAEVEIDPTPVEVANPIRFDRDTVHASYNNKDAVNRFCRVLILADTLFKRFSTNFYRQDQSGAFPLGIVRLSGHPLQRQ